MYVHTLKEQNGQGEGNACGRDAEQKADQAMDIGRLTSDRRSLVVVYVFNVDLRLEDRR